MQIQNNDFCTVHCTEIRFLRHFFHLPSPPFEILEEKKTNSPVKGNKSGSCMYIYNSLLSLSWVRFTGTGFAKG